MNMKPFTGPDIISGLRKPSDYPERKGEDPEPAAASAYPTAPAREGAAKGARPGMRRFSSHIRSLMILVRKPRLIQIDGEVQEIDGLQAKWVDGLLEVDPSTADGAAILKKIEGHSGYGRDYVDLDLAQVQAKNQAEEEWLRTVRANPDLLEKLKLEPGVKGFDLGAGARPIP